MYEVVMSKWVEGQGFSYAETFDNLDAFCTAEEYVNGIEPIELSANEQMLVEIRDTDTQEVLSSTWVINPEF